MTRRTQAKKMRLLNEEAKHCILALIFWSGVNLYPYSFNLRVASCF